MNLISNRGCPFFTCPENCFRPPLRTHTYTHTHVAAQICCSGGLHRGYSLYSLQIERIRCMYVCVRMCMCGCTFGWVKGEGKKQHEDKFEKKIFFLLEKNEKKNQCPLCECVRTEAEAATDRTVRAHARARTHTLHPDIHPCMNPFSSFFVCLLFKCLNVLTDLNAARESSHRQCPKAGEYQQKPVYCRNPHFVSVINWWETSSSFQ